MAVQLSDLQKLRHESSGEARAEVAEKLAADFASGKFSANEEHIAIEIFRLLLKDAEVLVRKQLSIHLAATMNAPHDVILGLARDVSEVALPVLSQSYVLSEEDLVAITHGTKNTDVMSAIANRDMVSRELADALVKKSEPVVLEVLLRNKSANISEKSLNEIHTNCTENSSVLELMVKRGGLPVTLAEKLFTVVSDEMKKTLSHQYKLSRQMVDDTVKTAREFATLDLVSADTRALHIAKLVEQLYEQGRLTLSMIIRSLCLGDMRFFEHAMSKLADVPITNAQILILDVDGYGFSSLYKASCLPMDLFPATAYLLKIALEETSFGQFQRMDFRQRLADRLMRDDAAKKIEYMDYLLTLIQNNTRDAATAVY